MVPVPAVVAWDDWWFAWALTNAAPVGYIDATVYRYRYHSNNFMLGVRGRDPEVGLDRAAAEIPFRRYLLGDVRPGTCSALQLYEACEKLRGMIRGLGELGRGLETFVSVSDDQRSAAERLASRRRNAGRPLARAGGLRRRAGARRRPAARRRISHAARPRGQSIGARAGVL